MSKFHPDVKVHEDILFQKLPLVITKITVQKKNSNRFSLFHKNEFLTGVSGKTLTDFSLQKGVELTSSLFQEIKQAEEYQIIKEKCFRYLGRRDHASFELKQKLSKKGFDEVTIVQVLDELAEKGFIDDEQFAIKFASDKAELSKWGPRKIKAALFKKGLKKSAIDRATKKITESLPQQQICVDLALKRKQHFLRENDPYKRKQKIFNYLAGRGFPGSVIKKSLSQITAKLDA
jgi:regulatory protein